MKKFEVDGFQLQDEHINMLLDELKDERIKTIEDLERYLKNHTYMKDTSTKCHLLMAKHGKKRNFAIPF